MSCPHCRSESIAKRRRRTSLGYRIYFCNSCRRQFNERTGTPFNDLQFPTDIVLMAVLWRLRYKLGLRDVAELLLQRGFEISYETIRAWEYQFAPLVSKKLRSKRRGKIGRSWYLDETYVKVNGRWRYLHRAIDRDGNLLDSMLCERRDSQGDGHFLNSASRLGISANNHRTGLRLSYWTARTPERGWTTTQAKRFLTPVLRWPCRSPTQ